MVLLVTHEQPDFDAIASLALARRLHPKGRIALPGGLRPEVAACVNLYRDRLDPLDVQQVARSRIEELVVVDTADRTRLGTLAERTANVRLWVYDHHPDPAPGDALPAGRGLVDDVGATVTLLVRELRRLDDPLPADLASLALLGLHEDTGGFSYGLTTAEDHDAAAWLMRRGGSPDLIRRFAGHVDSDEHRAFRARMLEEAHLEVVAGRPVAVAAFSWPDYLHGVSELAQELLGLHRADASLLAVRMEDRTLLFARAVGGAIDVAAALSDAAGGGGHPGAAFARSERALAPAVRSAMDAFARHARPPLRATDLMSRPVRSLDADTSVHDAGRELLRFGHNGMPVVEDGVLVGVVSRRDVERALEHGLGRSPVRGFMGTPPVTAPPDATLETLETLVAERGVGRLPIVDGTDLVGIVTRSDLLAARHPPVAPSPDPAERVRTRLPRQAERATAVLRDALPEGAALYLVGGSVRDALLGRPLADLDLALERAEAAPLARAVTQALGGTWTSHAAFGTAEVRLPGGLTVDLAAAREERYPRPGALPEVVASDVRRDLRRRDYTVNAMALRLAPEPAQLLDPFGGRRDLEQGVLRVLHPLSFTEDLTRVVRGARIAGRLGFAFEPDTEAQARQALDGEITVGPERLRNELERTVRDPRPSRALFELARLGALGRLYGLAHPRERLAALDALRDEGRDVPAAAYVLAMLAPLPPARRARVLERFHWPHRRADVLARLDRLLAGDPASETELRALGRAGRALLEVHGASFRARVRAFEARLGKRRLRGQDVIELGLPPGPEVGRVLDEVAEARLDSLVDGFEQELELARELVRRRRAADSEERRNDAT